MWGWSCRGPYFLCRCPVEMDLVSPVMRLTLCRLVLGW